jgi:hypothetical protein
LASNSSNGSHEGAEVTSNNESNKSSTILNQQEKSTTVVKKFSPLIINKNAKPENTNNAGIVKLELGTNSQEKGGF